MHDSFAGDIPRPAPHGGHPAVEGRAQFLDDLDVGGLLALRDEIDKRLPALKLNDMSLDEELIMQFMRVRELQNKVLEDNRISAQQKSAVVNSVASTLSQLIKLQTDLHTAERFKAIENLLIKKLKQMPKEAADAFIEEYERLIDGA